MYITTKEKENKKIKVLDTKEESHCNQVIIVRNTKEMFSMQPRVKKVYSGEKKGLRNAS